MKASSIFKVTRQAGVVAALLISVAMLLYPGGTFRNPSTSGYSFFQNSLSDLGSTIAWGGRPNRTGALFFATGCAIAALAGIGGFVTFGRVYAVSRSTRYSARAAGAAGVLSCVSLIGTALIPQDRFPALHGQLTLLAALACPVASLLLAWTSLHDTRFPRRAAGGWLVLALVLIAWVSIMQWGPAPTTDEWLTIPVTMQKIVAVAIAVVFFYEMHEVDRVVTGVRESAV
jgi:hypothetical protein